MENEAQEKPDSLATILAIVIAIVTVLSALVSWRVAVFEHVRVDEDLDGLLASVNKQETLILDHATAYDDLAAYTRWWQYTRLAEIVDEELRTTGSQEEGVRLRTEMRRYAQLALDNKALFPSRYLMPDDGYDLNRQLGEMWADAADEKDVDPAAHFEESDRLIARALFMLAAGAILSLGLVFYALVESLGIVSRHARWLLIVGTLLSAAGVILAILTQLDLV